LSRGDLTDEQWRILDPPLPDRGEREAYKGRNLIERCVNRLKQFRRIATRYEKTARAYLSMLCIASALTWIKLSTRPNADEHVRILDNTLRKSTRRSNRLR
jgi:transposase